MKILLAAFAIFAASNNGINADIDYVRLATNIRTNITDILYYLSQVDDKVQLVHGHLSQTVNTVDFKLAQNQQMIQLQDSIKAHRGSKGIKNCVALLDTKSQQVLDELKASLVDLVDDQLNYNKIDLFNIRQELSNIAQSLISPSLDAEIKICKDNPKSCKITIDYPNTLAKDRQHVNAVEDVTNKLVDSVFATAVMPTVADKINSDIYKPVTECIRNLA